MDKLKCAVPFSLLICWVQIFEACGSLPLWLNLLLYISAAQTLPQPERVPAN